MFCQKLTRIFGKKTNHYFVWDEMIFFSRWTLVKIPEQKNHCQMDWFEFSQSILPIVANPVPTSQIKQCFYVLALVLPNFTSYFGFKSNSVAHVYQVFIGKIGTRPKPTSYQNQMRCPFHSSWCFSAPKLRTPFNIQLPSTYTSHGTLGWQKVFQLFLDLICLPTVDKLRQAQTQSNADPFRGANSPDNSGTVNQHRHPLDGCYCSVVDELS